jgi:hypothetical protein
MCYPCQVLLNFRDPPRTSELSAFLNITFIVQENADYICYVFNKQNFSCEVTVTKVSLTRRLYDSGDAFLRESLVKIDSYLSALTLSFHTL